MMQSQVFPTPFFFSFPIFPSLRTYFNLGQISSYIFCSPPALIVVEKRHPDFLFIIQTFFVVGSGTLPPNSLLCLYTRQVGSARKLSCLRGDPSTSLAFFPLLQTSPLYFRFRKRRGAVLYMAGEARDTIALSVNEDD